MKSSIRNALWAVILGFAAHANSQGTFQNLDFEQAAGRVAPTAVGGWGDFIDPALAFPGWTVGNGYGNYLATLYNDLSLGAPAISLIGPNFPNATGYTALQGSYSVLLYYDGLEAGPPTLSQTGIVPSNARSIDFLVPAGTPANVAVVSLNGVRIPLVSIAGGRLAGDVTAFAGLSAQLTFSTPNAPPNSDTFLYLDDIQFSSSPAPEPSTMGLYSLGLMLLGCRIVAKRQRINP